MSNVCARATANGDLMLSLSYKRQQVDVQEVKKSSAENGKKKRLKVRLNSATHE